ELPGLEILDDLDHSPVRASGQHRAACSASSSAVRGGGYVDAAEHLAIQVPEGKESVVLPNRVVRTGRVGVDGLRQRTPVRRRGGGIEAVCHMVLLWLGWDSSSRV